MAEITRKRIAEFIAPFRVKPGRRVRLPQDFDPSVARGSAARTRPGTSWPQAWSCWPSTRQRLAAQDTYALLVSSRPWTRPARTAPSATS